MGIVNVDQMPGTTVSRSKDERTGFRGISITQQYRIQVASATDVPGSHPGFPDIGDTLVYEGFTLQCKANPIIGQDPRYRKFYYASATFDNFGDAGTKDITEQFPVKMWRPVQFREMVTDAEFLGVFDENLSKIVGLFPNDLVPGEKSPIVNSALIPRPKERTVHGRKFKVEQYFQNFDPIWESYQDTVNSDTFTLSQSDKTGEKWSFTMQPRTCLMEDVEIEEERLDNGLIYFKVTFNFTQHPKTWVHYEVDRGRKYHVFVGQVKRDGTQFTQQDLDDNHDGKPDWVEFTTNVLNAKGQPTGQTTTLSEPIKLNGHGQAFDVWGKIPHSAKTLFMGFLEYPEKPFATLNL